MSYFVSPAAAAAAAKSLQSCPALCDPIDGSPPGSPIPGILQALISSPQLFGTRDGYMEDSFLICEKVGEINGEGNGTPLQYSCLENPKDGGAWYYSPWGRCESDTTE